MTPGIFQPSMPAIKTALATEMEKCNKIRLYTLFRAVWKKEIRDVQPVHIPGKTISSTAPELLNKDG